jgi:RecG-like helicase
MPQGGYTETVSLNRVGLRKITAFVEEVSQRTNGQKAIDTPIKKLIPGITTRVCGNLTHITEAGNRSVKKAGVWMRAYDWQRWVLEDKSAHLLVEIKKTNSVSMRNLKIGSKIEVIGRIEKVGKSFRMTNPVFRVIELGNAGIVPRKEISNIGSQTHEKRSRPSSKQITSSVKKSVSKPAKSENIIESDSLEVERIDFVHSRAEHCSACGALVPNGASHDCK